MGAAGWDCCAAQFGGWSIPPAQPGQDLFGALAGVQGHLSRESLTISSLDVLVCNPSRNGACRVLLGLPVDFGRAVPSPPTSAISSSPLDPVLQERRGWELWGSWTENMSQSWAAGAEPGASTVPGGGTGLPSSGTGWHLPTVVPGAHSRAVKGRAAFKQHLAASSTRAGEPGFGSWESQAPLPECPAQKVPLSGHLGGKRWLKAESWEALQLPIKPKPGAAPVLM